MIEACKKLITELGEVAHILHRAESRHHDKKLEIRRLCAALHNVQGILTVLPQWEKAMRNAQQAVQALIDDDKAKTAQLVEKDSALAEKDAKIADLTGQLQAAGTSNVTDDQIAAINELVPEASADPLADSQATPQA